MTFRVSANEQTRSLGRSETPTHAQLPNPVRAPEFAPFLLSFAAFAAAQTVGGLALATLVFRATGSRSCRR
ncbi:hypothetical protein SAVCW2_00240 [Streptomyces avermitilis]|nr:hypothetical protein SAVCW2_00240 [Streptomyces avermitilis]